MSDITPLLLDAKKEYTSRLEEIVTPQLRATFTAMFNECVEEGNDVYVCFQGKMREIPFWNSSIVDGKTQQLITSYSFFENLVVAVVVTYVKVMSAIRLGEGRPNVKLKVPRTDEFVHEIYKQMAQICYYEPHIMESRDAFETQAIPEAIERSIRRLIPYEDILQSYLAADPETDHVDTQDTKHDSDFDTGSDSDSEDDDDDQEINVSVPSQQYTQPTQHPHTQQIPMPTEVPTALQNPTQYTGDGSKDDDDSEDDDLPPACPPYPSPPVSTTPMAAHPQQAVHNHQQQMTAPQFHQPTQMQPPQQQTAPPQHLFGPAGGGQEIRQAL